MTVTIYHNPACSKSRAVLELIRDKGIEPAIIPYLEERPTQQELTDLLASLGLSARDILRVHETAYQEHGLDNPNLSEQDLIALMVDNPILIERPIVKTEKGCLVCRPVERVLDLL